MFLLNIKVKNIVSHESFNKTADGLAENKYEEFDTYGDDDEAYDNAVGYWNDWND